MLSMHRYSSMYEKNKGISQCRVRRKFTNKPLRGFLGFPNQNKDNYVLETVPQKAVPAVLPSAIPQMKKMNVEIATRKWRRVS